ncbi:MAG: class I SAM-dependent RNA methyltransferase [Proteobacteria bacterium]|nr:class I SAM-dependent RNA methyltransferase [Pseudomonadota bacterium]
MKICRHFGTCGGCSFQDMPDDAYRSLKRSFVVDALAQNGLANTEVDSVIEVMPQTRRRAVFKATKRGGEVQIGFHAAQSHAIVDMHECLVITPSLFALVGSLREFLVTLLNDGEDIEVHATGSDTGLDIAMRWSRKLTPAISAGIARWAQKNKIARVTLNGNIVTEFGAVTVRFANARVALAPESFLQPTREGEAALRDKVLAGVKNAKAIADLFAGCGTFTFPLAQKAKVHAVELDKSALAAIAAAARATQGLKPITTEARDLFKVPLSGSELKPFDAVVMDPPRAGAKAQATALAASAVRRIVYVSCNAETFARDAGILTKGGYKLGPVTPVDQFLWSSHIELVAAFTR